MKFTSTPVKSVNVEKFDFQAAFEGISLLSPMISSLLLKA